VFSEIPVFPTVTAKLTFHEFAWKEDLEESLFETPSDYVEDPTRFPDLWHFVEPTLVHVLSSARYIEESSVGLDVPLSNLGASSAEMTLIFWLLRG